jgi:hypothetical protein
MRVGSIRFEIATAADFRRAAFFKTPLNQVSRTGAASPQDHPGQRKRVQ